jgi:hypothetical protein
MRYATLQCAALQCATLRYNAPRYATMRCAMLRYNALRYATIRCATLCYKALRHATLRTLRYATLQYAALKCDVLRYSTTRRATILYATLRCAVLRQTEMTLRGVALFYLQFFLISLPLLHPFPSQVDENPFEITGFALHPIAELETLCVCFARDRAEQYILDKFNNFPGNVAEYKAEYERLVDTCREKMCSCSTSNITDQSKAHIKVCEQELLPGGVLRTRCA